MQQHSPTLLTKQVKKRDLIIAIYYDELILDIRQTYKDNLDYHYTLMSFVNFVADHKKRTCYFYDDTIQSYKDYLTTDRKYKPATIKKYLIVAKDYCKALYERRYQTEVVRLDKDITLNNRGKSIKTPKVNTQLKHGFNTQEMEKIKTAYAELSDQRLKALIALMYFGAYRIGKCQAMTWSDIDFNKKTISVIGQGSVANSKAMHSEIEQVLWQLKEQTNGKGAIFKTANKQANIRTLRRWIQAFLEQLKIKGHNPHSFRHSSIQDCVRAGFTLEQLKYHSRHQGLAGLQAYISSVQAENSSELIEQTLTSVNKSE